MTWRPDSSRGCVARRVCRLHTNACTGCRGHAGICLRTRAAKSLALFGAVPEPPVAARDVMRACGIETVSLSIDALLGDDRAFEALEADHLVLGFDDTLPLLGLLGLGGHRELQRQQWLARGRSDKSLIWLDLRAPPPRDQWRGSADYVAKLGVSAWSAADLIGWLSPAATAAAPPDRWIFISHASEDRP